jgi:hypothetical protein
VELQWIFPADSCDTKHLKKPMLWFNITALENTKQSIRTIYLKDDIIMLLGLLKGKDFYTGCRKNQQKCRDELFRNKQDLKRLRQDVERINEHIDNCFNAIFRWGSKNINVVEFENIIKEHINNLEYYELLIDMIQQNINSYISIILDYDRMLNLK